MVRVKLSMESSDGKMIFGTLYEKQYIIRNYKESWNKQNVTFSLDFPNETEMFRVIGELNSKCRSSRGLIILNKEAL